MLIYKRFQLDSAHFLPNVPAGHKCKNLHGHTYMLTVFIEGAPTSAEGWVMDFGELKKIIKPVIDQVDHQLLNVIPGLENPSTELFAIWCWERIKSLIPNLKKIELSETPSGGVIYEGF